MTDRFRRGVILDNYDSFTHNLAQGLGALGASVEVHRNDAISLAELRAAAPEFLVISPGPGAPPTSEDPLGVGVVPAALSHFRGKIPVLAVCLGLQVLAEQFGATVTRSGTPCHGKRDRVWHDGSGLFAGVPNPFVAARYHSLSVRPDSLPSSIAVRAWTEDRTIMAFGVPGEATWAVQFHPESFMTPDGPRLLENFLAGVICPLGDCRASDETVSTVPGADSERALLLSKVNADPEPTVRREAKVFP